MTAEPIFSEGPAYRTLAWAEQYEEDRRIGAVVDNHRNPRPPITALAVVCPKGPACGWPIHCCKDCGQHSLLGHDCQAQPAPKHRRK